MSPVMVEGRALELCRSHAAMVVASMPATFADLRALFVGMGTDVAPPGQKERRSPIDRRSPADRRFFPPRPEGRRASFGRRATDPTD
jgi:hypothetical protein